MELFIILIFIAFLFMLAAGHSSNEHGLAQENNYVTQLKSFLENISDEDKAYVLLKATHLRFVLSEALFFDKRCNILLSPLLLSKNMYFKLYSTIEREYLGFKNSAETQYTKFPGIKDQMLKIQNSYLVWMVTLKVRMETSLGTRVQEVWDLLKNSYPYLDDAVKKLEEEEKLTQTLYGKNPNSPENIGDYFGYESLKEAAQEIPRLHDDWFSKKVRASKEK